MSAGFFEIQMKKGNSELCSIFMRHKSAESMTGSWTQHPNPVHAHLETVDYMSQSDCIHVLDCLDSNT